MQTASALPLQTASYLPRPAPSHVRAPRRSLFRNLEEVEKLSELGVLFLLFEMGLELSIDRLRVRCMLGWAGQAPLEQLMD